VTPLRPQLEMSSTAPGLSRCWAATGHAAEDLPRWFARSGFSFSSAAVDVRGVAGPDLQSAARAAFGQALESVRGDVARVWAFLPRITEPDADGLDRYMWMNRGRSAAYAGFGLTAIPAGTCTGHAGALLVVHVLGCSEPFRPVENPRQRPAWNYSERFGPSPPPFTRGVVIGDRFLTSGTASVTGEETAHVGKPHEQWDETMRNLDALSNAAGCIGEWRSLRIYVRDAEHVALFASLGAASFAHALDSVLVAPMCRPDLLVEVEGVRDV